MSTNFERVREIEIRAAICELVWALEELIYITVNNIPERRHANQQKFFDGGIKLLRAIEQKPFLGE